jgi:hypothetical protein
MYFDTCNRMHLSTNFSASGVGSTTAPFGPFFRRWACCSKFK